jgi:quinol monooxygenase YgiN
MKPPDKPNGPVTLINVVAVEPEKLQLLLDQITYFSEHIVSKFPGFISATFHVSFDRTRVTNIAKWESQEAFFAMIQSPEVQPHMAEGRATATYLEHNLYAVVGTFFPVAQRES